MYDYTDIKICELWPQVVKIEMVTKQTYRSAFNVFIDDRPAFYTPDRPANFLFRCINDDCTEEYFNLYSIVSGMVSRREGNSTGTLRCEGNEAKDHDNSCPCVLDYEIKIEYQ